MSTLAPFYVGKMAGMWRKYGAAAVMERLLVLCGPTRSMMLFYHRKKNRRMTRKLERLAYQPQVMLTADAATIKNQLQKDGFSPSMQLPADITDKILAYACETPIQTGRGVATVSADYTRPPIAGVTTYTITDPHKDNALIRALAYDPQIMRIAGEYLGVETPLMIRTRLYWSFAKRKADGSIAPQENKKLFHFDVSDSKSISVFFYLTDVDEQCGPHAVIKGTHGNRTIFNLSHWKLTDSLAEKRYGKKITTITGRRGAGFFEDLYNYHKHSWATGEKPRLVLTFSYVIQRIPKSNEE